MFSRLLICINLYKSICYEASTVKLSAHWLITYLWRNIEADFSFLLWITIYIFNREQLIYTLFVIIVNALNNVRKGKEKETWMRHKIT